MSGYKTVFYEKKGKVKANFLRHEGYLGAIGAFLKGCEAEVADIEILKPFENLENSRFGTSAFETKKLHKICDYYP